MGQFGTEILTELVAAPATLGAGGGPSALFEAINIFNAGAVAGSVTGSKVGSVAMPIAPGQSYSLPPSEKGYAPITADGTGTSLQVTYAFG